MLTSIQKTTLPKQVRFGIVEMVLLSNWGSVVGAGRGGCTISKLPRSGTAVGNGASQQPSDSGSRCLRLSDMCFQILNKLPLSKLDVLALSDKQRNSKSLLSCSIDRFQVPKLHFLNNKFELITYSDLQRSP